MSLKFTGSFSELKQKLVALKAEWDETQGNKKVLRKDGGILNWFESTGSIQFQGKQNPKEELEYTVKNLLYPEEFPEQAPPQSRESETLSKEDRGQADQGNTIEWKYLNEKVTESELVIGVVVAVGTESKRVVDPLRDRIKGFGYEVEEIRVSAILPSSEVIISEYDRIRHYMNAGDELRRSSGNNAILAAGVANEIRIFPFKCG